MKPVRIRSSWLLLLFGICLSAQSSAASLSAGQVYVHEGTESVSLSDKALFALEQPYAEVQAVHRHRYDIPWQQYTDAGALRLGYQDEAAWITFSVSNTVAENDEFLLEVGWPLLARVDLFAEEGGRWTRLSGGRLAESDGGAVAHRNELFPLTVEPGAERRFYLRIESDGTLLAPITLWQRHAFHPYDSHVNVLLGLFFGAMGVMLLYNLSLAILTRDTAYLAYVLYVASVMAFQATVTGVGALYIWGDWHWFEIHSYSITSGLGFATAMLFGIRFLELRRNSRILFRMAQAILCFWVGLILAGPLVSKEVLGAIGFPMGFLTCALSFLGALYLAIKGNRSAFYFVIAWTFVIVGATLYIASMAGIVPRTPLTEYAQSIGSLMEVILLSFALAERINRINAERVQAQQHALAMTEQLAVERAAKITAQNNALEIQQRITEDLEERVRERTQALESTLEELGEANLRLEKTSRTDPLTGLSNRRHFDAEMVTAVKRCNRAGQALAVLFADIDHFKHINDVYGHSAGDHCLQAVASVLQARISRAGDLVARYGGEEFVALLPGASEGAARDIAEDIRGSIERLEIVVGDTVLRISISIGVAGWVPRAGETTVTLLGAADEALYKAKDNGRNRVEIAPDRASGPQPLPYA